MNEQGSTAQPAAGEQQHAVFLSYASDDAEAAGRICEGLRAAGIEVWYDRSELRGGDAWGVHRVLPLRVIGDVAAHLAYRAQFSGVQQLRPSGGGGGAVFSTMS